MNPEKPIATFENCQTEILIRKVDQDDVALAGATFGLFDEKGELVKTATSDPEGMVRFVGAAYGRYTIRELEAPEGYLLSKDVIHVTLDDGYTNSPTPLSTVVNHQKKVSYIKVNTSGHAHPRRGVQPFQGGHDGKGGDGHQRQERRIHLQPV